MPGDEIQTLRVTTRDFPGKLGVDAFLDVWARKILCMEMNPLGGSPLDVDMTLRCLPNLAMASGALSPMRNRHLAAEADNDDAVFVVVQRGQAEFTQHGRTAAVSDGEAVLTVNGADGISTGYTPTNVINFRLSRALLSPHVADIEANVARTFSRDNRLVRLLTEYASLVSDPAELATSDARRAMTLHVHDLTALLLGSKSPPDHARGLRAARLQAIKADIMGRLGRQNLRVTEIAQSQQLSPSYIRKLFASEDTNFTDFVLENRLARAHRMLIDPRHRNTLITAIALDAGFGDISYFNRAFRRRYGATPSDVRALATAELTALVGPAERA